MHVHNSQFEGKIYQKTMQLIWDIMPSLFSNDLPGHHRTKHAMELQ